MVNFYFGRYTGRKTFMEGLGCILENGMKRRFICRLIIILFDPIFSGNIKGFKLHFSRQEYLAFLKVKNSFNVARFLG